MDTVDRLLVRVADFLLDKIFLVKPRIFNVGYPAYLLWILHLIVVILRDHSLGVLSIECSLVPDPSIYLFVGSSRNASNSYDRHRMAWITAGPQS